MALIGQEGFSQLKRYSPYLHTGVSFSQFCRHGIVWVVLFRRAFLRGTLGQLSCSAAGASGERHGPDR